MVKVSKEDRAMGPKRAYSSPVRPRAEPVGQTVAKYPGSFKVNRVFEVFGRFVGKVLMEL